MKFNAISSGFLIGLVNVILLLIMYIMGPSAFTATWLGMFVFVLNLALIIYFGIQSRKEAGGYYTYGQAYKFLLITALISIPLNSLAKFGLMNMDPDFFDTVNQTVVDKTGEMLEGFGLSQDKIDAELEKTRTRMEDAATFTGTLMAMGIGFAIMLVINLLVALAIKKKQPEFS